MSKHVELICNIIDIVKTVYYSNPEKFIEYARTIVNNPDVSTTVKDAVFQRTHQLASSLYADEQDKPSIELLKFIIQDACCDNLFAKMSARCLLKQSEYALQAQDYRTAQEIWENLLQFSSPENADAIIELLSNEVRIALDSRDIDIVDGISAISLGMMSCSSKDSIKQEFVDIIYRVGDNFFEQEHYTDAARYYCMAVTMQATYQDDGVVVDDSVLENMTIMGEYFMENKKMSMAEELFKVVVGAAGVDGTEYIKAANAMDAMRTQQKPDEVWIEYKRLQQRHNRLTP